MTIIAHERAAIEAALARLHESHFTHHRGVTHRNPLAIGEFAYQVGGQKIRFAGHSQGTKHNLRRVGVFVPDDRTQTFLEVPRKDLEACDALVLVRGATEEERAASSLPHSALRIVEVLQFAPGYIFGVHATGIIETFVSC